MLVTLLGNLPPKPGGNVEPQRFHSWVVARILQTAIEHLDTPVASAKCPNAYQPALTRRDYRRKSYRD